MVCFYMNTTGILLATVIVKKKTSTWYRDRECATHEINCIKQWRRVGSNNRPSEIDGHSIAR